MILTGWDESKVDFAKAGAYDTTGTLALAEDNTPVELTIPIQVTITGNGQADEGDGDIPGSNVGQVGGSDWDWPEESGNTTGNNAGGSDGTGKLPAQTGDASAIPAAMAVLAISAAAIYVLRRRKK